jgi:hypothetical protein
MSDPIPPAVIAELTAFDESAMPDMFTITYTTFVSDGAGGSTETTTTASTKGRLKSVTGDEAGTDQIRAQGRHRISVPKTSSVPATARITQDATGKEFMVKYPFPVHGYSTSLKLGVEDV